MTLNKETSNRSILKIIRLESDEAREQARRDEEYRQKVINAFFEYGKLKSIPALQKKERIILEVIADAFEYNRIYPERKVNIIIADFCDDFCTIRRDLVAEKLLDRNSNGYWRIKPQKYCFFAHADDILIIADP